jgi:D-amino peptidase
MEGLSGQNDWETFESSHRERFKQGQSLLAGDVNAVIDGLAAGGAQVIDVFDQHGSGQPDSIPDLPREMMDRRANPVFMTEAISGEQAAEKGYDALVLVGEHSKTGRRGFASHTVTLGIEVSVNGATITEAELKALQWGKFGVPVIFAAGDDRLQEDLRGLPWIQYVVVKHSTSASTADLIPVDSVHREMREKAKLAVRSLAKAKVVRVKEPATIAVRAVPPANVDLLQNFPGLTYAEHTVTFVAPSFTPEGFLQMIAIIEVAAALGRRDVLAEMLESDPKTTGTMAKLEERYFLRWLDVESGRWPPAQPAR